MLNKKVIYPVTIIILSFLLSKMNLILFIDNIIYLSVLFLAFMIFGHLFNIGAYDSILFSLGKFKHLKTTDEKIKKKYSSYATYLEIVNETRGKVTTYYYLIPIVLIIISSIIRYIVSL